MKTKATSCFLLLALLLLFEFATAIPPDTLDFGFAMFVKARQMLSSDEVRYICLHESNFYPWAVAYRDKIVFLDEKGAVKDENRLPLIKDITFSQSSDGQFLLIRGLETNRADGFERLYRFNGSLICDREIAAGNIKSTVPVDGSNYLLTVNNDSILVRSFDGDTTGIAKLHEKELYEDGEIYASAARSGKEIFALVNRFKLPLADDTAGVLFYLFNRKLEVSAKRALPYLLVNDVKCTPDGRFISFRAECKDGSGPIVVLRSDGTEMARFAKASFIRFSPDNKYLLHIPRSGTPEFISTKDWSVESELSILRQRFPWADATLSRNKKAIFFDGNELYFVDLAKQKAAKTTFPYAFTRCRLSNNGRRLILTGEFGFIIYDLVR